MPSKLIEVFIELTSKYGLASHLIIFKADSRRFHRDGYSFVISFDYSAPCANVSAGTHHQTFMVISIQSPLCRKVPLPPPI